MISPSQAPDVISGGVLTLLDCGHLGLQQHLVFQVNDLPLVCVHNIQRRVHHWQSTGKGISTRIRLSLLARTEVQ